MNRNNRQFYFILALLGLSSLLSWNLYFRVFYQKDTVNIHQFPKVIGKWFSHELPISSLEYNILETRNAFARVYHTKEGKEVFLFIVYSQHNRKVSHPPEVCYTGSGISVINSMVDSIDILNGGDVIESKKLTVEKGNIQQIVYYWFKVGNKFTSSYWQQQFLIAFNTVLGKPVSSAMIRVSATIKDANRPQAEEQAKEFTRLIYPQFFKILP